MIDFKKINKMLSLIEESKILKDSSFNEFAILFYKEVKLIPLSKYLRTSNRGNKLPKIMSMRKAGELLYFTQNDEETLNFLKRKGHLEIPQLNYRTIMILRKMDPIDNWTRILDLLSGEKSIEEINLSTRRILFPQEIEKLENFIKNELKIENEDFDKFMKLYMKAIKSKEIMRAIKKLSR